MTSFYVLFTQHSCTELKLHTAKWWAITWIKNGKGSRRKSPLSNLTKYTDIFLEGPRNTTKNLNHNRLCPDRNFYLGLPEYKPGLPPIDCDLRSQYYKLHNWYRNYLVINLFLTFVKVHSSRLRLSSPQSLTSSYSRRWKGQNNSANI
jgi:hypothetical protein